MKRRYSSNGRAVFVDYEDFVNLICNGKHCFLCCAKPNKTFNKEHVLPNWLLKQANLHRKTLTLPNGNQAKYATYKILCCEECNSLLGQVYEEPISQRFSEGFDSLHQYVVNGGYGRLCSWLALLFLKVHLRNFNNPKTLDQRFGGDTIGSSFNLSDLHHIYLVARAAIFGVKVQKEVFGTLVLVKVQDDNNEYSFDYCDSTTGRALHLRLGEIALIHVLDDSSMCAKMLSDRLGTIPAPITPIQLRELFSHYVTANLHLESRPLFQTMSISNPEAYEIIANFPKLKIRKYDAKLFGNVMRYYLEDFKNILQVNGKIKDEALIEIEKGEITFLA